MSGPLGWMLLIYIAALVVLFLSAFWKVDPFTGQVVHDWGLQNFKTIFQSSTYREIALRTVGIAAAVTVTDAILAFPFAYFAARLASRRLESSVSFGRYPDFFAISCRRFCTSHSPC